jgi:hypothetical protein
MMPGMGAIDLFVRDVDAARARELIDEAESDDPDAPGGPGPQTAP